MSRTILGVIGACITILLVILVVFLPVSGAGMTSHHDGIGYQFGQPSFQNGVCQSGQQGGFGNGTCIYEDCPHKGIQPRDGSGMHYGRSWKGSGAGGCHGSSDQGYNHRFRI